MPENHSRYLNLFWKMSFLLWK